MGEIDASVVGLLLDTHHMNIEGENLVSAVRTASDRLSLFDVADSNRRAVGRWHIPFLESLRELDKTRYSNPFIVECTTAGQDPFTTMKGPGWYEQTVDEEQESIRELRRLEAVAQRGVTAVCYLLWRCYNPNTNVCKGGVMKGLVLSAQWEPRPGYEVSEFEKRTGKAVQGFNVWRHPKLEMKDVPQPQPGPGEVLLKIHACGVCGSDIHFYEHDSDDYILYPGLTKFPAILGHEFSGEIVEIGPGPEGKQFKVGDKVTAEEMVWCGHCRACRDGFPNHCANLEEIGFTIDGAMAEYIVVPAKLCWSIDSIFERYPDEETAWNVAATTEPTCVAYNGIFERAGGFRPGAYVVVYGAGPIGLGAIQLSKASGAAKVISFEVSGPRRELAKKVGADAVYNPIEVSPSEVVMDLTGGAGADLSVEAAGAPDKTIPEMEKTLAINGKIAQIGRAATRVPMYLEDFQVRRGQLFGAQGHSGHAIFPSVIRMMGSGLIDNSKIITSTFPLAQALDALEKATKREDGKIVIKP